VQNGAIRQRASFGRRNDARMMVPAPMMTNAA